MIESRRRAYLEAMGFDIWSARLPEPESNRLLVQPGEGDTLLVCDLPDLATSQLAGDVARALGGKVVWAWPDPEGGLDKPTLEDAVDQYLVTRVVVFGAGLVGRLYKGEVPSVVGSALILVTDCLEDLASFGRAKLAFWNQISGKSRH